MGKELTYQVLVVVELPKDEEDRETVKSAFNSQMFSCSHNNLNLPEGVFIKLYKTPEEDINILLYMAELDIKGSLLIASIDKLNYCFSITLKNIENAKTPLGFFKNTIFDINEMIDMACESIKNRDIK